MKVVVCTCQKNTMSETAECYQRITDFSVHVKTTLFINSLIIKRMMSKFLDPNLINRAQSSCLLMYLFIFNFNSNSGCL